MVSSAEVESANIKARGCIVRSRDIDMGDGVDARASGAGKIWALSWSKV